MYKTAKQNLEHAQGPADLRCLGMDLLKLAAPIVAQNPNVSEILVESSRTKPLGTLHNLEILDLSHGRLSDEECVVLAQLLQHQVGLVLAGRT